MDKRECARSLSDAERLAAWARRMAAGTLTEEEEGGMEKIILECLESGSDEVFDEALYQLCKNGEEKAATEFKDFLGFQSECFRFLVMRKDGSLKPAVTWLFAIPIVFVMPPESPLPICLTNEKLGGITESFLKHRLVGDEQSIFMLRVLYSLESLTVPASRKWQFIRNVTAQLSDADELELTLSARAPFMPPPEPAIDGGGVFVALRYLVGVNVSLDPELSIMDELPQDRLDAWNEEVNYLMSGIGNPNPIRCEVGNPRRFSHAIHFGIDMFRFEALLLKVSLAISTAIKRGDRCFVDAEGQESGLLFSFRDSRGNLLGEHEFPVLDQEDPDALLDRLSDFWERMSDAPVVFPDEERFLH